MNAALIAALHHLSMFALFSALLTELVLLREAPDLARARRLLRADLVYGLAAAAMLGFGLLRMFLFEKSPDYYLQSLPFLLKLVLFALVGILSIYPTLRFMGWRKSLRAGQAPETTEAQLKRLRLCVHSELTLLLLMPVCAALAAKGIG